MRGKKYLGIVLLAAVAIISTGCGEKFPELTEEQYDQTVEYAAGLLMRYSNNGQERLIYVDAKEVEKQRKKEEQQNAQEEPKKTETTKPQTQEQKPTAPEPATPEPVTPEPVSETTVQDAPEEEQYLTGEEQPVEESAATETSQEEEAAEESSGGLDNAITLSSDDSEEIIDDIFLSYQGYSVSSTYPESSKSYVVNADKGKKLLVLRFDLYNGSGSAKKVNLIPLNLMFQIVLNGKNLGYSSVTFLPNDLSSYSGTIDSRAHESVVVLTQISEKDAKNIQTLGLIASMNGKSQNVNLK